MYYRVSVSVRRVAPRFTGWGDGYGQDLGSTHSTTSIYTGVRASGSFSHLQHREVLHGGQGIGSVKEDRANCWYVREFACRRTTQRVATENPRSHCRRRGVRQQSELCAPTCCATKPHTPQPRYPASQLGRGQFVRASSAQVSAPNAIGSQFRSQRRAHCRRAAAPSRH